jgi:hypothetical protein
MKAVQWVAAIVLSILVLWGLSPLGFTLPVFKYEPLNSPQRVVGWSGKGLMLADGRVVLPKGMKTLPLRSAALAELTRRGVEVDRDGQVYGQVNLWHWCGNDPVRSDVRRVDIAHVLAFVREGKSDLRFRHTSHGNLSRQISDRGGWAISEYSLMEMQLRGQLGGVQRLH